MYTAILRTKSRLSQSLGENLWNEFEQQAIPLDDRIEILAGRNETLWMHISVIKKVSGIEFLDSCRPFHFSENSASRCFVASVLIDIKFIKYVARLMYLGSACVPKDDLPQLFCTCHQFKIAYVVNGDAEPTGQIVLVGAAEHEHQPNDAVPDSDGRMDIDGQSEADLGATAGQQSSVSNINDSYSDIGDTPTDSSSRKKKPRSRVNRVRKKTQLDSDTNPVRKKKQLDSDKNSVRKKKQPDSGTNPVRKKKQPDSGTNPVRKKKQPDSGTIPVRKKKQLDSHMTPGDGLPAAKRYKPV